MPADLRPLLPADVPVGRVLPLPGRGEIFFRHHTGGEPGALPVLLLHGWTASADIQWCTLYERLGRTHPFVAPDHRGHGRGLRTPEPFTLEAAADDAAALCVALGLEKVIVCGYSMGGPVSLLFARRHPHLVAGLVLEATAMEFHDTRVERGRWLFRAFLESMLRSRVAHRLAHHGLVNAVKENPALVERQNWLAGELRRGDHRALAEAGRALQRFDARGWAGSLGVPTSVLLTTRDQLVAPAKQRALATAMRAEVVELNGDHYCTWFRGAEFAAATERLLASVVARLDDAARDATAAPAPASVA